MIQIVDVELTPNPLALKFVLNTNLLTYESRNYKSLDEALNDPFAKEIFAIEGVVSVYYAGKFITVEKESGVQWGPIQRTLINIIKNFPIENIPPEKVVELNENETELLKQIRELIEQKVRPALANDGGGLEIISFNDMRLKVRYHGACGSCPSATRGTLIAIENLLRREINPELEVVSE